MRVYACTVFFSYLTFYVKEGKDRRDDLENKFKHRTVKIWRIWERHLEAEETGRSVEIVTTRTNPWSLKKKIKSGGLQDKIHFWWCWDQNLEGMLFPKGINYPTMNWHSQKLVHQIPLDLKPSAALAMCHPIWKSHPNLVGHSEVVAVFLLPQPNVEPGQRCFGETISMGSLGNGMDAQGDAWWWTEMSDCRKTDSVLFFFLIIHLDVCSISCTSWTSLWGWIIA